MNKAIVTGAAGFIGSNLVDSLLRRNYRVLGIDNLSTGKLSFLDSASHNPEFRFVNVDLLTCRKLETHFQGADVVFHLSANADVRFGPNNPSKDFEQNTLVTHKVLEATRICRVKNFVFSSTGSVYGENRMIPTPEDAPFPIQTSLYGASKLAGEGLVEAYSEAFGIRSWIFRFVSILGPRYSHGHVYDFYKQLKIHPDYLTILGNGQQKKSYLHVNDCLEAIFLALQSANSGIEIFNLGHDNFCEVKDSAAWICDELNLNPVLDFGMEIRGWIGDSPLIWLDTSKIKSIGWIPSFSIEESVRDTVSFIKRNEWILDLENE